MNARGSAAATVLAAFGFLTAEPSLAVEAQDAGAAVVVDGAGSTTPLAGGTSSTPFSFDLPGAAACPGDSANDGYRVQSFMVPATVDPATIMYDGLGPTPSAYGEWATFRQPMYEASTRNFASAQTANADAPGEPGPIVDIPPLTFAVYGTGELPPGRYRVGIACSLDRQTVRYWDAELVLERAPDERPAGIRWRVAGFRGGSSDGASPPLLVVPLIAAAVAVVALRARRRHSPRPISPLSEAR